VSRTFNDDEHDLDACVYVRERGKNKKKFLKSFFFWEEGFVGVWVFDSPFHDLGVGREKDMNAG
jgi:hypothetical protein